MNHLKALRFWAAAQPRTARFLIAIICTLLCTFAFEFGLWLEQGSLLFVATFLSVNAMLACWSIFSYSAAVNKGGLSHYEARKLPSLTLYLVCFALWGLIGNQSIRVLPDIRETSISNNHSKVVVTQEASFSAPVKPLAKMDKRLRGLFKKHLQKRQQQLRGILAPQEMHPVAAFFLFFFLGLLALALAYFLLFLSCSLSCNAFYNSGRSLHTFGTWRIISYWIWYLQGC